MPLEKTIVGRIIKQAKLRPDTNARKMYSGGFSSGWPDVMICQRGYLLMVEVKQPGNKATPLQLAELARWRAAGARTLVAFGWPEVEWVLDDMP